MLGDDTADPAPDLGHQFRSALFFQRPPDGRDHQVLIVGKQQQQGGIGGAVQMVRAAAAGQRLDRPLDEARLHQLVELLGNGGASHGVRLGSAATGCGGLPTNIFTTRMAAALIVASVIELALRKRLRMP